jgi:hypothetical protein
MDAGDHEFMVRVYWATAKQHQHSDVLDQS